MILYAIKECMALQVPFDKLNITKTIRLLMSSVGNPRTLWVI